MPKYRFKHKQYHAPLVYVRGGRTAKFEEYVFDTDDEDLAKLLRESAPDVTQIKPKPRGAQRSDDEQTENED